MNKVLVIEDNPDNAKLIGYALKRRGYEVVVADTGMKGIELSHDGSIAFILMDIDLPGMDGLEATSQIRRSMEPGEIPIIAVTSCAMAGDIARIIAAGCTGYFEKPIDPLTIVDDIESLIARTSNAAGDER